MFVILMLNSANEWETSVVRFRSKHTALTYAYKHKLDEIYNAIDIVAV